MNANPCGLTGPIHNGPDKTQLTPEGEVSAMRNIFPTDTDTVTFDKVTGSGKNKETESLTRKVKEAVRDFVIASNEEKSAKDKKDEAALVLRAYVKPVRDQNAYNGDYQKSFRVAGIVAKSGMQYGAMVAHMDRWTLPKKEVDIAALKKLVGDKFFKKYFEKDITIAIKSEVLNNKEIRKELTDKLLEVFGVEGLKKYFKKEEVWAVKDGLDKGQYDLDEETRQSMLESCKQYADKVEEACFDPKNTL